MLGRFKLKAKEGRLDNAEVMQMLRSEMAKQGERARGPRGHRAAKGTPGAARKAKTAASTRRDVISLDDDNFGKF